MKINVINILTEFNTEKIIKELFKLKSLLFMLSCLLLVIEKSLTILKSI